MLTVKTKTFIKNILLDIYNIRCHSIRIPDSFAYGSQSYTLHCTADDVKFQMSLRVMINQSDIFTSDMPRDMSFNLTIEPLIANSIPYLANFIHNHSLVQQLDNINFDNAMGLKDNLSLCMFCTNISLLSGYMSKIKGNFSIDECNKDLCILGDVSVHDTNGQFLNRGFKLFSIGIEGEKFIYDLSKIKGIFTHQQINTVCNTPDQSDLLKFKASAFKEYISYATQKKLIKHSFIDNLTMDGLSYNELLQYLEIQKNATNLTFKLDRNVILSSQTNRG